MTTKKSSTEALGAILDKLEGMEARISAMETKASTPEPVRKLWENTPTGEAPRPIAEGTKVRLLETSEHHSVIMGNINTIRDDIRKDIEEDGILGTVGERIVINSNGNHKVYVDFAGIGTLGVPLSTVEPVG